LHLSQEIKCLLSFGKLYKRFRIVFGSIVFTIALSGVVKANTDTIPVDFMHAFKKNLDDLISQNIWEEPFFYSGTFLFDDKVDLAQEYQKNILFADLLADAHSFFYLLNQLPIAEKQNLIQCYSYYQTFFEKELKDAGLPEELKYFAPALSAMNTKVVGKYRRAGIWQLTHFQGILNDLNVNRLVDERLNIELATKAVVKQLRKNIELFNSSELAVLAYLAGNAKLRDTKHRVGKSASIVELLKQLPPEISETIAAYQALSVFLSVNRFNPDGPLIDLDEVVINRQVHFRQIEQVLNIPQKTLQFLNPQYTYNIIPGDKTPMIIRIPAEKRDAFVLWTDSIYNAYDSSLFQLVVQKIEYPPAPNRQYVGEKVKDLEIEGKTKIKYTIKSGDVLGFIAEDYDVRVADLKYWNNIYNERRIQVGQKLDIFVDDENADYYRSLQKTAPKAVETNNVVTQLINGSAISVYKVPDSAKKIEHIVKSGESPYLIAKKYKGVTPEAILEWNGISDARRIQIGQKLIIYIAL